MEIGNATESISVTGEALLVDSRSSAVGTLIDSRRVVDLPTNGRNALIGPPATTTNVGLFKTFQLPLGEGLRLQFRSEFFNLFNSVNPQAISLRHYGSYSFLID